MKEIWKYKLIPRESTIKMPGGSKVLSVGEQFGDICLWAEVHTDGALKKEERVFEIFGTGHTIYEDMGIERKYLGTIKMEGGTLIFHVYERI